VEILLRLSFSVWSGPTFHPKAATHRLSTSRLFKCDMVLSRGMAIIQL
jgi:hypothetical protein